MKRLLNKIKPLDYKNSPIGSLKVEIMFHLSYLVLLAYISGTTYVFNKAYTNNIFEVYFEFVFILMLFSWCRLAYLISTFVKEKDSKNIFKLKNISSINKFNKLQNTLLNETDGMEDYRYLSDYKIYNKSLLMLEKLNNLISIEEDINTIVEYKEDFKFLFNILKQVKHNLKKGI